MAQSAPRAVAGMAALVWLTGCAGLVHVEPDSPLGQARGDLAEGRFAVAAEGFRDWLRTEPDDPRALLGLGAALEGLGQLDSAAALYDSLEARALPRGVREHLEGRRKLLARRVLRQRASQLATEEEQLQALPPTPRTVAVFPFVYAGPDSTRVPLGRALAHLVVTDVSQVASLRLVERQEVQFLLEELALAETGRVDPATSARPGRLLRAEHVITGALSDRPGEQAIRLDGVAVRTETSAIAATSSRDDQLRALFDLEKDLVFRLLDGMGVSVTPLEAARIAERPTGSLEALMAFGRGLAAEDRGDFLAAARGFGDAAARDPAFRAAAERAGQAARAAAAQDLPLARVATLLDLPATDLAFLTDHLNHVMGTPAQPGDPPGGRDGVGDVGGQDRLGGVADVFIRVKRP